MENTILNNLTKTLSLKEKRRLIGHLAYITCLINERRKEGNNNSICLMYNDLELVSSIANYFNFCGYFTTYGKEYLNYDLIVSVTGEKELPSLNHFVENQTQGLDALSLIKILQEMVETHGNLPVLFPNQSPHELVKTVELTEKTYFHTENGPKTVKCFLIKTDLVEDEYLDIF